MENDRKRSPQQLVQLLALFIVSFDKTFGTCEAFSHGGRSYPSKLSDDVLESIELFKLAKPRIYGGEIRERLLSDRIMQI